MQMIRYDDSNMLSKRVGTHGTVPSRISYWANHLRKAKQALIQQDKTGEQGFLSLPSTHTRRAHMQRIVQTIQSDCTDVVILGIGGSDLGARAIQQAVGTIQNKKLRIHFAGSSTDPDALTQLLQQVNPRSTALNVISKSGGTLETMTSFLVLRDRIKKAVGKNFAKRIVATTDPEHGSLLDLAKHEGYEVLHVPKNVGGRFSVLSDVGLFPAMLMGVDTSKLLRGAQSCVEAFRSLTPKQSDVCRFALHHAEGLQNGKTIFPLMVYSSRLEMFAKWTRQLIAESLGKAKSRSGNVVHIGPTPTAAIGPEDQHSQLQLYAEGPYDKLITFIEIDRFDSDVTTPRERIGDRTIQSFMGRSLRRIIHVERAATAESLARLKRPNGTIFLPRLSEETLGQLFLFYEIATAMLGELLNVNAYDQPGVELSKKLMSSEFR